MALDPHGGTLVARIVPEETKAALRIGANSLNSIVPTPRELCDLEMLAIGAFSPLIGFQGQADFVRVCREMRLADGTVWPIPITLSIGLADAEKISVGER